MSVRTSIAVLLGLATGPGIAAQEAAAPRSARAKIIADSILRWVEALDADQLTPQGKVVLSRDSNVDYVQCAVDGGVLEVLERPRRTTHFTLLQDLVTRAERNPSRETAEALLAVASTGLAKDMFNHRTMMVRDLGHFALLRLDSATAWDHIHRVATTETGKPVEGEEPVVSPVVSVVDPDSVALWRVAGIRAMGMKGKGVFRSSIERCLASRDARIRLAAAEALGFLHSGSSVDSIKRALESERHPMVVVALVQATHRILNKHALDVPAAKSEKVLLTALTHLSKSSWRADMTILQLLHDHGIRAAVPRLIGIMRQSRGEADPILKIINRNASLMLGKDAHRALRKITGALVPEDPDLWQAFWDKEGDTFDVRRRVPADQRRTHARMASGGSFYGIPVLGSDVVFVLDTSGSMKQLVKARITTTTADGKKQKTSTLSGTRLAVARRQTLKAIQGMPEHAHFSIVTFNSFARAWNREPVRARRSSRRIAARILSRLKPKGGTNVFDALVLVLEGRDIGYGETAKTGVDEVFVLSDGMPTAGELTNPDEILRVVQEINKIRKVRINTVFAGEGPGADFMQRLAEQNNGIFVQQ